MTEQDFRRHADAALEALKKRLYAAENNYEFEVEDQAGALQIAFEDGARFVVSPNAPVQQIWISALSTSFKLDWNEKEGAFVLAKSQEALEPLLGRLIGQQLGEEGIVL